MLKEIDYPPVTEGGMAQKVSWGAIFAGAISSLAVTLALVSLGMGVGFIAAPAADAAGGAAMGLGVGSAIWTLLCGVIGYYVGGWIAGRMTGYGSRVLHGFVSWGTATVMFAFLFTSAALGAFGAASNVIGLGYGSRGGDLGETVRPGVADEVTTTGTDAARNASRAAGAAGLFAFLMMACNAAASCYGASNGSRLTRIGGGTGAGSETTTRRHHGAGV